MATSSMVLSLRRLRDMGMTHQKVEHWNHHAGVKQDLFGFIDILALGLSETLAIQTTTKNCVSEHINKIANSEHLPAVRRAGWRIELWGWTKVRGRWKCTVVDLT